MNRNQEKKVSSINKKSDPVESYLIFIARMVDALGKNGALPEKHNVFPCLLHRLKDDQKRLTMIMQSVISPADAKVLRDFLAEGGWVIDENVWELCRGQVIGETAKEIYEAAGAETIIGVRPQP